MFDLMLEFDGGIFPVIYIIFFSLVFVGAFVIIVINMIKIVKNGHKINRGNLTDINHQPVQHTINKKTNKCQYCGTKASVEEFECPNCGATFE
ncbi:MAG: hypothetical protein IJZ29_04655 [Clostridia bacterium]|nr:hypothetical protein [Clostridia bacterium]